MERIEAAGAGFRSLTESIDTTVPAGRMMMQMVGAFAEFERAIIRERTSAGLAEARAEGRIGGRCPKLDAKKLREIAEAVTSGRKSGAEMARLYDVSEPTVSRIVDAYRAAQSPVSPPVGASKSTVPWNALFCARLGYRVLTPDATHPDLLAIQARHVAAGIAQRPRVAMRKRLQ
jgi:DNA invertase Pin-like site-specific DNA recombinase